MPLLKLQTSVLLPDDEQEELIKAASKIVAQAIGKPEQYVMVTLEEGKACMGGEIIPGAFADVRSIGGLDPATNTRIAEELAALLEGKLDIRREHIYLNFADVAAANWGWNGSTFG